jgi:hypothetical protein
LLPVILPVILRTGASAQLLLVRSQYNITLLTRLLHLLSHLLLLHLLLLQGSLRLHASLLLFVLLLLAGRI